MGNFLVSSVCRVHGRSEAVYAIVRAQVSALRGRQIRGSPLQRQCAAQQAALLRAFSSKMALTAAVMSCWMAAATTRARAALITSLVFIAKKIIASSSPQLVLPEGDEDDVFDEFNAVFETAPRSMKTIRERQHRAKLRVESFTKEVQEKNEAERIERVENSEINSRNDDHNDEADGINPFEYNLDEEYEMLPELEDDRAFYADPNEKKTSESKNESEQLLQLALSISDTSMHVEGFIATGKHKNFEAITKDVAELAEEASESEKRSVVRVLLAYCAYNEDWNYSREMVVTAGECLRVWQGDEDRALKSLAVLCNDVPRLCAALE